MDFASAALSEDDLAFRDELRKFLGPLITDEVIARDRETGQSFDEGSTVVCLLDFV